MSRRNRNRATSHAPGPVAGAPADLMTSDATLSDEVELDAELVPPMLGGRSLDPDAQTDELAAELARMESESPAVAAAPVDDSAARAERLARLRQANATAIEDAATAAMPSKTTIASDQAESLRQLRAQTATGRRPMSRLAQGAPLPQAAPAPTRQRHGQAEQIHATQLFPELFPYPSPNRPDIWIDPKTGRPTTPRYRTGGQFAARLLIIQNTLDSRLREVGLPMAVLADHWGVEPHEAVVRHVEVVFDFEDDRDAYLETHGRSTYDPLKKNDEAPEALAGLLGPTVARAS